MDFLPRLEDRHIDEILARGNPQAFLKNAKIVVHDSIDSPGIFGFFRPAILLPDLDFTDDELLVIFAHESAHHHYGHNIVKCIATLILSCFWWNPFFKNMTSELAHALELHADKFVCKSLKETQYETYLFCIAKVASHVQKPFSAITCSFVEEKEDKKIKQRFQMILDNMYHKKKKSSFLIIPVFIGMFFLSYSIALQPYSHPNASQFSGTPIIISYLVETKEGYDLYDSKNMFIDHVTFLDEGTKYLKIYKENKTVVSTPSIIDIERFITKSTSNVNLCRYQRFHKKLWKRLWSSPYNRWEEPYWTLA